MIRYYMLNLIIIIVSLVSCSYSQEAKTEQNDNQRNQTNHDASIIQFQPLLEELESDMNIVHGTSNLPIHLSEIIQSIIPGMIVMIGEIHNSHRHHYNEIKLLEALDSGYPQIYPSISVGLEFFDYTEQHLVDKYINGELSQSSFLEKVNWTGTPFELYQKQALFPIDHSGQTLALNAPRELTGKIARYGMEVLIPEEIELLPPNFEIGNTFYRERFLQVFSQHNHGGMALSESMIENYFTAQSVWDDTMAWIAVNYIVENPTSVLVIIVGDFHIVYGGGLPARIRNRGYSNLITISQINTYDLQEEEIQQLINPHPEWGKRADFIMITEENLNKE